MNLRSALRAGASRFGHLSATPGKPAATTAKAKSDAEKVEDDDEEVKKSEGGKTDEECKDKTSPDDEEDDEDESEECKKAKAAGHGAALKQAWLAERARCAAILASQHAQGRVPLACELAFDPDSDLSAKSAVRYLAASPSEGANSLASALANAPKHAIGDDAGKIKEEKPGNRLLAAVKRIASPQGASDPVDRLAAALADRMRAQ